MRVNRCAKAESNSENQSESGSIFRPPVAVRRKRLDDEGSAEQRESMWAIRQNRGVGGRRSRDSTERKTTAPPTSPAR